MGKIHDAVNEAIKAKKGQTLTPQTWDPKAGEELVGVLVHREVIQKKDTTKMYDKVTVRTDDGVFDTILRSGILALASPPAKMGDFIIITYNGMKKLDNNREMHDSTVIIVSNEDTEGLPF